MNFAKHGPTVVRRYRLRVDDLERLTRIQKATASKNEAAALRHALVVADARLNNPDTLGKLKESGPTGSTTLKAPGTAPAPTPPLNKCPRGCGYPLKRHKLDGACPS